MKHQLQILVLGCISLFCHTSYGQWQDDLYVGKQANNWIFYNNNGLNFNTQPPSNIPAATTALYYDSANGCGSISDTQGSFLFSSSSATFFNSDFQPMAIPQELIGHFANVQEGLIVPVPNTSLYYVFHMQRPNYLEFESIATQGALYYSIVDMNANGNLGGVTAANILLDSFMSGKITAVHHAERDKVWAIGHGMMDTEIFTSSSNKFHAYLISENGISAPVISEVGPSIANGDHGQMKVSPDGKKIAFVNGGGFLTEGIQLAVFDFDNSTGQISNPVILTGATGGFIAEGLEFSPNGRYLYISEYGFVFDFARIYQFDLEAGDQDAILASKVVLAELPPAATFASMQLAPDGKIYVANPTTYEILTDPDTTGHLSVIHNPNNPGISANFEYHALATQNECSFGLPGFIQSYFESGILHEGQCVGQEVNFTTLRIPGIESVTWNFGDPDSGANNSVTTTTGNSVHIFSAPGTYTVVAEITSNGALQTASIEVTITQGTSATRPADLTACGNSAGIGIFDLSQQEAAILGTQDPNAFTVSYHSTYADAVSNSNPIGFASAYSSAGTSVYARVTAAAGCYAVTEFNLIVVPLPILPDNLELPGCSSVNLGNVAAQVGEDLILSFYFSQSDAEEEVNPITNIGQFELADGGMTVYLRGETAEGCADVAALLLIKQNCGIPRGISPNGDSLNDGLDLSHLNIRSLEIFNRYGLSVYKKEGYRNEWHGQTDSGGELSTGTYFYVLSLEQGQKIDNKEVITGWIYINRQVN